jgi:hypothetical protein
MIRIIMGIYSMYKNKHEWLPGLVNSEKTIQVEVLSSVTTVSAGIQVNL